MGRDLKEQNRNTIPVSKIDRIHDEVKKGRRGVEIIKEEGSIKMRSGAKELIIQKDGRVKGAMPLHSFETYSAEKLEIRDDEILVQFHDGKYTFKI